MKKFICKKCGEEFSAYPSAKRKICSRKCNGRKKKKEEKEKISKKVKAAWKNGVYDGEETRKKFASFTGKTHTKEHNDYMSELLKGRNVTWKDKIKKNHWSNDPEMRKKTLDKIKKSRETSEKWNSDKRRNTFANWSMDNPDKVGHKFYKRGKYKNKKRNQYEYHASGFEREFMKQLDSDGAVIDWTKKHGIIIEYNINGKIRKYYPDVFVKYKNGVKKLIETKGRIYDKNIVLAKINAAEKWCKENEMVYEIIFQRSSDDPRQTSS